MTGHSSGSEKDSSLSEPEKSHFNGKSENASGIMSETATVEKLNNKSLKNAKASEGKQEKKMQKTKQRTNPNEGGKVTTKSDSKDKPKLKPKKSKDVLISKDSQSKGSQLSENNAEREPGNKKSVIETNDTNYDASKPVDQIQNTGVEENDDRKQFEKKDKKNKDSKDSKKIKMNLDNSDRGGKGKSIENKTKAASKKESKQLNQTSEVNKGDEGNVEDELNTEVGMKSENQESPSKQIELTNDDNENDPKQKEESTNIAMPEDDSEGRLEKRIPAPWDKDINDNNTEEIPERKMSKEERRRRRQSKPHVKDKIGKIDINILQKELSK